MAYHKYSVIVIKQWHEKNVSIKLGFYIFFPPAVTSLMHTFDVSLPALVVTPY